MHRFERYKIRSGEKEQSLQRNTPEHYFETAFERSENVRISDYPACKRTDGGRA